MMELETEDSVFICTRPQQVLMGSCSHEQSKVKVLTRVQLKTGSKITVDITERWW